MKIIVIGASAASISFITKLRTFDTSSEIICFSGEKYLPYNRCFLADLLSKTKSVDDIQLKPEGFYQENNVDLRLGQWVDSVDYQAKTVCVQGEKYAYDRLFLGVGSHAVRPPFYQEEINGLSLFHTLEDIEKIDDFLEVNPVRRAVVIGAGLNGLECSFALFKRGISVSVVDCSPRVLAHQVDEASSEYVQDLMQGKVDFIGDCFVEKIVQHNGKVSGVRCKNGREISADLVVCAAGARVQNSLIKNSPLIAYQDSLVVDAQLRTSDPAVYAAGDVVFMNAMVGGVKNKSMTWSDAMLQGLCAATQFSPAPRDYQGLVGMRDSEFFDKKFYACGETVDVDSFEVQEQQSADSYHRLYLKDGCVRGFVIIGNSDQMPFFRQLYITQKKYS
jgi:NAD(P)H-nitrite reductase large subunit